MKTYAFLLLSLGLSLACHKSLRPYSAQSTSFPNDIGDQWLYAYSPSGDPAADTSTIQVNIVGEATLPDGEAAKIWVTKYSTDPGDPDTTLVTSSDTAVTVYFNDICLNCAEKISVRRKFNFPLQVGKRWMLGIWDTTRVLALETLQVPAGSFPNTFRLAETMGFIVNTSTRDTLFLTPGIGLSKFLQDEYSLGPFPGNGLWQLSAYKVN